MHEVGVTEEILRTALDACDKAGGTRLTVVRLTVGALTELVPDSMQFAWECLTPGTKADGAVLEITEKPGVSRCPACDLEFEHDRFDYRCTRCGGFATELVSGHELLVSNVDVDLPGDDVKG